MTLADEIEHVNAYLRIEQARFQSSAGVSLSVPDELAYQHLPAFTLQLLMPLNTGHRSFWALGITLFCQPF